MSRTRLLPSLAALCLAAALTIPAALATAAPDRSGPAAAAAAKRRTTPRCTSRRGQAKARRGGCTQRRRTRPRLEPWGQLRGDVFEFDDLQISGTMTATAAPGADFGFEAQSSTVISPKRHRVTDETPWVTTLHGRIRFDDGVVAGTAKPVTYRITSSATIVIDGEPRGCPLGMQLGSDGFSGVFGWDEERNRVVVSWTLPSGGWDCDTTVVPSCGHRMPDTTRMYYKEIEFTRRWARLPIDLQWRTSEDAACEFRFNGYVRLKKVREGS